MTKKPNRSDYDPAAPKKLGPATGCLLGIALGVAAWAVILGIVPRLHG